MAGNNTTSTAVMPKGRLLEYWGVWSVLIILGITIIVCNLAIIVIYIVWKQLRNPTNTFLVMLAIADLLVGLLFIPLYIGGHYIEFYHNVMITEYLDVLILFTFYASVINLYAVTIDRYIAVMHALRYNALMTTKAVSCIVAAAWFCPAAIVSALLICKITNPDVSIMVMIGFEVVFVIIPSVFMTIVYVKIFMEAKRQINAVAALEVRSDSAAGNGNSARASKRKSEQKVAQTCALLLFVYLMCWIPTCVEQILLLAQIEPSIVYTDIALILMISNSAINPILYGLFKQDFRSKLKRIIRRPRSVSKDGDNVRSRSALTSLPMTERPRAQTLEVPADETRNGRQERILSIKQPNPKSGDKHWKTSQAKCRHRLRLQAQVMFGKAQCPGNS
eukprot:gene19048-20961_t